ncbi:MAG: RNA-binding S4 domain-containing protein [Planctomycetota bacterium]
MNSDDKPETIDLDRYLKWFGHVQTGGEAKLRIQSGDVQVNGEQELRRRRKLRHGDEIMIDGETSIVNRDDFEG